MVIAHADFRYLMHVNFLHHQTPAVFARGEKEHLPLCAETYKWLGWSRHLHRENSNYPFHNYELRNNPEFGKQPEIYKKTLTFPFQTTDNKPKDIRKYKTLNTRICKSKKYVDCFLLQSIYDISGKFRTITTQVV